MTTSTAFPELKTAQVYATYYLSRLPFYSLYITYGKTDAWTNDSSPPTPNVSVRQVYDVWNNMIGARRLLGGDFAPVVTRYNWTSGTIYTAYDDQLANLQSKNFYVVTDDYNVYKCICNANSQNNLVSTIKPTSVSTYSTQKTSDGYIWKYMYTISDSDQLRFTTDEYIPARSLEEDDGSLQWQVQTQAYLNPGTIDCIKITNSGSGYTNASNIVVTVSGDGTGFNGYATLTSKGNVDTIVISSTGINYSYADVTIKDVGAVPGSNATARAIISPPSGHGGDPIYELYASAAIADARFKYDEEGIIPTTNDYRQIALINNPSLNPFSSLGESTLLENADNPYGMFSFLPAVLQAYTVICPSSGGDIGDFVEDEIVYQGNTLDKATFTGRVVSWNSGAAKLLLINTKGELSIGQPLLGSVSLVKKNVTSKEPGTLKPYSGNLLYVNNLKPITRSPDQIEDFKILVKF